LDAIYAVTLDAGRQIIATSGRLYGDTTVRGSFSLGEEDAIVRAAPGQLALREEFSVERAVMGHGNELRYVFLVTGSHGESVVDAETGQVLARREGRGAGAGLEDWTASAPMLTRSTEQSSSQESGID